MLRQVDGSLFYWIEVVGDGVAALLRWMKWLRRLPSRLAAKRKIARAARHAQLERLTNKIAELEREHQSLVKLFERVVEQRDHYFHLYLQAMRAKTAA